MQGHGLARDVRHLMEAPVVHFPKRVEDAALHGLQAVIDVRDGAVEDDVARVVEKPGAVVLGEGRVVAVAEAGGRLAGEIGVLGGGRGGRLRSLRLLGLRRQGGFGFLRFLGRGRVAAERELGLCVVILGLLALRHRKNGRLVRCLLGREKNGPQVSTRSFSTRRFSMMKSCRCGVFLPM
jgi:hypothetical protein